MDISELPARIDEFERSLTDLDQTETDLPELQGKPAIRKAKKDIVRWIWAGEPFEQAVKEVNVPLIQANRWRNPDRPEFDPRFDMWCAVHEEMHEQEQLAAITRNVMEKAQENESLGLQVLKARRPEKWNPGKATQTTGDDNERRRFIPKRGTVDATFREVK